MSQFTPTQRKSRLYENHPLRSRAHPREPVFLSFGLGPRSKWYNHAADAPDLDRDHAYYLYHVEFKGSNVNDHWGLVLYQETGHGAHASEGRLHHIVEPQAKVTGPRAADLHHAIVDHADPSHAKDKYKSETLLARVPEGLVDDVERVVSEASGEEHPWITRNPVTGQRKYDCQDWTIQCIDNLKADVDGIDWVPNVLGSTDWGAHLHKIRGPDRKW